MPGWDRQVRERAAKAHAAKKRERGWICRVVFSVTTTNQFTDETHQGNGDARWWPLAFWRARRDARHKHAMLVASPGARTAMGWAE